MSFGKEPSDASSPIVVDSQFKVVIFGSLDPLMKLFEDIPGTFRLIPKMRFFFEFEIIINLRLHSVDQHIEVIILQDIPILQDDNLILVITKTQPWER